jgi:putative holliday junction resolvase
MEAKERFLGLDFGSKRIGVALSDELGLLAHAMDFIPNQSPQQVFRDIERYVSDYHIDRIVVGLPKTFKGGLGTQAETVLRFVSQLESIFSLPIVTWDERLTSAQAERLLVERDLSRAKRRMRRDAAAAELMLQTYMDYRKKKENERCDT